MQVVPDQDELVIDADVCVVGGACAGLTAAACAVENGAKKVVLLEKMKRLGGTLGMCGGFFAVESPAQERLGITHTADECFADLIQMLYWNCDATLVRDWIRGSGESVRWLESKGLRFDRVVPFQGITDFCRSTHHVCSMDGRSTGMNMLKVLVAECEQAGVEVLRQARARHLLTDDSGRVTGVLAEQAGRPVRVNARGTILATGSISANEELIARFYGGYDYSDVQIMARIPHNTGDGLVMAEEVGAKIGDLSTLFIGPHNHGPGHSELTGMLIRRPQPLKVNANGDRFMDEGVWTNNDYGWMVSYAVDRQPGRRIWIVCDARMIDDMIRENACIGFFEEYSAAQHVKKQEARRHSEADDFDVDEKYDFYYAKDYQGKWLENLPAEIEAERAAGRVNVCETLDDIAVWIGCSADALKNTLTRYNALCHDGYDADFLKQPRHLIPLETPPYYVFQGFSGIDTCIGGIHVEHELRVIDQDQRAIPGLYAAGVCTSGWLNRGYAFYGSELSFTLYSGRTAGANAARTAS